MRFAFLMLLIDKASVDLHIYINQDYEILLSLRA